MSVGTQRSGTCFPKPRLACGWIAWADHHDRHNSMFQCTQWKYKHYCKHQLEPLMYGDLKLRIKDKVSLHPSLMNQAQTPSSCSRWCSSFGAMSSDTGSCGPRSGRFNKHNSRIWCLRTFMYEKNTLPLNKHDFSGLQNKPKIQQYFLAKNWFLPFLGSYSY